MVCTSDGFVGHHDNQLNPQVTVRAAGPPAPAPPPPPPPPPPLLLFPPLPPPTVPVPALQGVPAAGADPPSLWMPLPLSSPAGFNFLVPDTRPSHYSSLPLAILPLSLPAPSGPSKLTPLASLNVRLLPSPLAQLCHVKGLDVEMLSVPL
ncbi:WAS/WASL-interacting protein family member 3-like [Schistocerca nitens]|uniref:WAS/WASL-interacting protein family member 3-like n=1 Tax=Schistocerca nitens TaxID=7011 RepID=UPI00211790D8|nr:WAS/WASL-interacting protein family member 3-like [Schistocerca nitens]